jgi:hypothetical protein
MPINTNCPNCDSDTTLSISAAITEIATVRRNRKISKGEVAFIKRYAFNKTPTSGCIIAIPLLLGGLLVIFGIVWSVIGDQGWPYIIPSFIIGPGLIVFGILLTRANSHLQQRKLEHAQWLKKLWMCKKCGHEWNPE